MQILSNRLLPAETATERTTSSLSSGENSGLNQVILPSWGWDLEKSQQETPSLSLSPKLSPESSPNQAILPTWGQNQTQRETPTLSLSSPNTQNFADNPTQTTISYTYDSLYRLTDAVYSNEFEFHYTYDPVGNRLTQTSCAPSVPCATTTYGYDAANRLITVNGVAYTWDDNGNLLNDGTSTYAYGCKSQIAH